MVLGSGKGKGGKARAEGKVLGPGPLVLGKAKAEKAGTRLLGSRLLGRARAEEKERKKWSCGPLVLWSCGKS